MDVKKQEVYLKDWQGLAECAERMLPLIGHLYRDNNIVTTVFGRPLVNSTTIDILKAHRFARLILDHELCVLDTFPILEEIAKLDLAPARIDIGKLITRYQTQGGATSVADFVRQELASINTGRAPVLDEPQDVVLYGFGRIGRLLARLLVEKSGSGEKLRLRAAVVRKAGDDDLVKRASLLRRDSVHGHFNGIIASEDHPGRIHVHRCRRVDGVLHRLQAHPATGIAR